MNKNDSRDPEKSVVATLVSDLSPVAQDLSEIAIDGILEDGLLEEIPLIKTVVGVAKVGFSIRDRIYLKKVISFLGPLSNASTQDREVFVQTTLASEDQAEKFSEAVVSLIERADSRNKTKLYGMFFLAHIEGTYNYDDTLKFCSMIDRAFWSDLIQLPNYTEGETENNLLTSELYKNGFMDMNAFDSGQFIASTNSGAVYTMNWYGQQVAEMILNLESSAVGT